jgi:predicted nucleotide-binding protein
VGSEGDLVTNELLSYIMEPTNEMIDKWRRLASAEGDSFDSRGFWMDRGHVLALVRPGSEAFPFLHEPVRLIISVTFDQRAVEKSKYEAVRILDTDFRIGLVQTVLSVLGQTVSIVNIGQGKPALFYTREGSVFLAPLIQSENPRALGEISRFPGETEKQKLRKERVMTTTSEPDPTKVFVVHGRNDHLRKDLFAFLRAIGLHPIEWSEAVKLTNKASPYIGEILEAAFGGARAVIVLLSPDDEGRLRGEFQSSKDPVYEKELTPQPRQNVIFEAGLAFGHKPDRTIIVKVGQVRPFSDVYGRHEVRLTNEAKDRKELANRLSSAGCVVNLMGDDWLSVGNFEAP